MEKVNTTWESFAAGAKQFLNDVVFQYVPKFIVACIVLFVGWKLINMLNKVMKRTYDRHKVDPSLQEFLHSLIDILLKVLLVLTAMGIMGIQMTSFIAILGAAGVAIGMGLQGTLQNFAGGVIILLLKPFKVGDYIEQGSYVGYVDSIQIFNTTLRPQDHRAQHRAGHQVVGQPLQPAAAARGHRCGTRLRDVGGEGQRGAAACCRR